MVLSSSLNPLFEKLDGGLSGICLYGIAPPKLATEPERLHEIAAQQVSRLRMLAPDGLVVYDIQDEPGRSDQARPFPFLPTVDPEAYAYGALAELAIPKIVYRCVGAHSRQVFSGWLDTVRTAAGQRPSVFVGAPRGRSSATGLPLAEAYALARAAPNLVVGGIAIAERHAAKEDEHQRMLAKQDAGCRFFITQSVYDSGSTKSLLSDYALSLQEGGRSAAPGARPAPSSCAALPSRSSKSRPSAASFSASYSASPSSTSPSNRSSPSWSTQARRQTARVALAEWETKMMVFPST